MRFYYTSSAGTGTIQGRPDLSLGGYRSSNIVPNNVANNLFGDVSVYSIQSRRDEYIGLILRNDTGRGTDVIRLWFTYPTNCQVIYSIAAVALTNEQMEHIENCYQAPYYATFFEADGEVNAVDLGSLADGEAIGIWIKKSINADVINQQYSDDNLKLNGTLVEEDESIGISIDWVEIVEVEGVSSALTSVMGDAKLTLSPPITGLVNTDFIVTVNGLPLEDGGDYNISELTDDAITIQFTGRFHINNTDTINVIFSKPYFIVNVDNIVDIPNQIA